MDLNNTGVEYKYLLANDKDRQYGLAVNTVGFQTIPHDSPYPLANHPEGYFFNAKQGRILHEYQFIYITKGSGVLTLECSKSIPVSMGQIIVLFPGQWHSYSPVKSSGWNEYYIGFSGAIAENLVKNSFLSNENQVLNIGFNDELVGLFKRAIEIVRIDKMATQQHLLGIVMHMVGIIIYESQNKQIDAGYSTQIIENAKIIMNEHVFHTVHPEELAATLNINYTSFRKLFKLTTGFSPARFFLMLKIKKAKQLLMETSMSVKEIAYKLSFYSPESFIIAFKKSTGETPSKYRTGNR